jgi:alpha(1,3/1,4) fucosyltransferase
VARTLAVVTDPYFDGNRLFDPALNRDDILCGWAALRATMGADCVHTLDVVLERGERPDALLVCDVPAAARVPEALAGVPRLLLLQESEVVIEENWAPGAHDGYEVVFTWRDPLIDGSRYRKVNFASRIETPPTLDPDTAERNVCTLIAGNKRSSHPHELYGERVRAIRWFETHHFEEFELHGTGWGDGPEPFPSWCGAPPAKRPVLERFWFSICYENARGIPGYVTEKIFDAMKAGNVPVYLGPDNITDHIPAGCFIDARAFSSYEQLYGHLVSMEPEEYGAHLAAAAAFLAGPARETFSDEAFAATIAQAVAA